MKPSRLLPLFVLGLVPFLVSCPLEPTTEPSGKGTEITVGTFLKGESIGVDEKLEYHFKTNAAGTYTIYVNGEGDCTGGCTFGTSPRLTIQAPRGICGFFYSDGCVLEDLPSDDIVNFTLFREKAALNYDIIVISGTGNEGSTTSPITLTLGTDYNGTTGSGNEFFSEAEAASYYQFTTSQEGDYSVELTAKSKSGVKLSFFKDKFETFGFASCSFSSQNDCKIENLSANTTYTTCAS